MQLWVVGSQAPNTFQPRTSLIPNVFAMEYLGIIIGIWAMCPFLADRVYKCGQIEFLEEIPNSTDPLICRTSDPFPIDLADPTKARETQSYFDPKLNDEFSKYKLCALFQLGTFNSLAQDLTATLLNYARFSILGNLTRRPTMNLISMEILQKIVA